MKNKSFKNYYDEIQVDENLLQQSGSECSRNTS